MALVIYVLALFGTLRSISADDDCKPYYKGSIYQRSQSCLSWEFCCGSCSDRSCCSSYLRRLNEDRQEQCPNNHFQSHWDGDTFEIVAIVVPVITTIMMLILCCVCPCCCLYKMCRRPRPVMATTTHTTTVVTTPYTQNAAPAQQYPGQYPGYQPVAPQPGYGTPYGGQPMPSAPQQGQGTAFGPPPPYQDIAGPGYPVNYSGAAFTPGQQSYPLQPPMPAGYQNQPPPGPDFNAQPAYNPEYVAPPAKPMY